MPVHFEIVEPPADERLAVRRLAKQIRDLAHLNEICAQTPDPKLRSEVRMMLASLVDFEVPPETEEPDDVA